MTPTIALATYLVLVNVITYIIYRRDKRHSRRHRRRVPEATLLTLALAGGAFGAWCAMTHCRHKTQHLTFRILIPAAAILWLSAIIYLILKNHHILPS